MALENHALCVGINRYSGLTPLQGAEADARSFHDWVTRVGRVPKANAKLILSSDFPVAPNPTKAQPASQEIWDFFENLRAAASANNDAQLGLKAGGRLYLFFSGHGFSPTLDTSGVLMANAEIDTPHNISAKAWADRFYENGVFDEILLFQDACREQVSDVEITPPYLKRSVMPGARDRRRFYAFAAKSPLLALEKPLAGTTRGVFSATLMAGLEGGATDPLTGQITAAQLKSYLVANMAARLDSAEMANEDVSQRPEVFDLDPFVIVSPPPAAAAVRETFPVKATLPAPGHGATILDHTRKPVEQVPPGVTKWETRLPLGLFELVVPGRPGIVFKVSGALSAAGKSEVVNVR